MILKRIITQIKNNPYFSQIKGCKKGSMWGWLKGLVSLFGLGIAYVVFDYIFKIKYVPVIKDITNNSGFDNATIQEVTSHIDKFMVYWEFLPYILFFVVVLYMIVLALRKEGESEINY